jgi:hypothetical protein
MTRQPYYEPHPVTPERKKELIDCGYRILDAKFAPQGWKPPALQHDVGEAATAAELRKVLDSAGVEYAKNASKAKLVELVHELTGA